MGNLLNAIGNFFSSGIKLGALLICVLFAITLADFLSLGLARRTFVFYTIKDGVITVEDRMIKRSGSKEEDIIRYAEEALLGPEAQDRLLPLFPRGAKLKSLMLRNGIVYADLSSDAEMPPVEGGAVKDSFIALKKGILRNFPYVKEVRFFIEGRTVYRDEAGSSI